MRNTIIFAFLATSAHCGWGQAATATATQGIRIQTYALGSYAQPDFNGARAASGGVVGTNLNIFKLGRFQPSLDARASMQFGAVSQMSFGGGPRLALDLGRLHPYADYLVGYGVMHFTSIVPAYTQDNSIVTSLGGGVDVSLNNRWAVRIDAQRQGWQFTPASPSYHPLTLGVGLRYQFHFKSKNGPE